MYTSTLLHNNKVNGNWGIYNYEWLQAKLNGLSPNEFRTKTVYPSFYFLTV